MRLTRIARYGILSKDTPSTVNSIFEAINGRHRYLIGKEKVFLSARCLDLLQRSKGKKEEEKRLQEEVSVEELKGLQSSRILTDVSVPLGLDAVDASGRATFTDRHQSPSIFSTASESAAISSESEQVAQSVNTAAEQLFSRLRALEMHVGVMSRIAIWEEAADLLDILDNLLKILDTTREYAALNSALEVLDDRIWAASAITISSTNDMLRGNLAVILGKWIGTDTMADEISDLRPPSTAPGFAAVSTEILGLSLNHSFSPFESD